MAQADEGTRERVRAAARRAVRHSFVDLGRLEEEHPGRYPRMIVGGERAHVTDIEGHRLLDSSSHLGACAVGHGRGEIADAMARQARALEFASLAEGISNPVAVELAEHLAPVVPVKTPTFWFCSSGSESNEAAFKAALAYHRLRGESQRTKILARAGSYHGTTIATIAAAGLPSSRGLFDSVFPGIVRVAQPSPGRCGSCSADGPCTLDCAEDVERTILREGPETVAALIAEPVAVPEAVKVPDDRYWPRLREICERHGVVLIADEVITGFGRLGSMFGLERWRTTADIVTIAKGITSGYAPLGAAAVAESLSEVLRDQPSVAHINTYAGHPVSCAAALASLNILERERLVQNAAALEPLVSERLADLEDRFERVAATSAIGLLASAEISTPSQERAAALSERVRHDCYERGQLLRCVAPGSSCGMGPRAVVYFYPPLCVTEDDVNTAFDVLRTVLGEQLR